MRATGVALAVVGAMGAAPSAAGDAAREPALELTDTKPLAVHGTGFEADEGVRLVLRRPAGLSRRRSRAGPGGEFSSRFPAVTIGGCSRFSIVATGDAGSRATLLRRPPVGCPP
jgi:hypothetical protein